VTTITGTPSRGALGDRRDDVVGLEAVDADVAVAERLDERLEVRPLLAEQVGPRRRVRLVVRVDLLAARRARVPDDDRRLRPCSVRSFTSIDAKPKIAFVGKPVEVAIDSGSAKKAGRRASCRR
jgi:hypothetical protein